MDLFYMNLVYMKGFAHETFLALLDYLMTHTKAHLEFIRQSKSLKKSETRIECKFLI